MGNGLARIIGIARHRLPTDGDGVTTLVAFHGCRSVVVIASITGRSAMEFISGKEEKYENLSPIQDCALDGVGATRVAPSRQLYEKFGRVS